MEQPVLFGMNRKNISHEAKGSAAAVQAYPELVTDIQIVHMDVNTVYDSPKYGRVLSF